MDSNNSNLKKAFHNLKKEYNKTLKLTKNISLKKLAIN